MSHESSASAVISLAESTWANNAIAAAALTMLWYDYTLTLSIEVETFWKNARVSLVSILFIINRYLGLLGPIPVIFEYFIEVSQWRCRQLQRYHQYYAVTSQVVVGMLLVIRTWALYNRSRKVLMALVIVSLALVIMTLLAGNLPNVTTDDDMPSLDTIKGCDLALSETQGIRSAVGWIAMLCIDTTVFVLTLFRTLQMRHVMYQPTLLMVLFRDGAVYYAILAIANAANVVTFVFPHGGYYKRGLLTTLANALSTTLVSRIFLNLRDPSLTGGVRRVGRWTLTGSQADNSVSARMISFCRRSLMSPNPEQVGLGEEESMGEADGPSSLPLPPRLPPIPPARPTPLSLLPHDSLVREAMPEAGPSSRPLPVGSNV